MATLLATCLVLNSTNLLIRAQPASGTCAGGSCQEGDSSNLADDYSALLRHYSKDKPVLQDEIPRGSLFVGHTNTDTDAVTSAIVAAHMYGGVPARAGPINPETQHVLKKFGVDLPAAVEDLASQHGAVILTDHNQHTQIPAADVVVPKVRGIIDHHALQANTIVLDSVVHIDIKAWGSTCTILMHRWWHQQQIFKMSDNQRLMAPAELRWSIGGLMLAGILSDTLGLRGPTTTAYDVVAAHALEAFLVNVSIESLTREMLSAKSDISSIPASNLVSADYKRFTIARGTSEGKVSVGFGVIEAAAVYTVLERKDELVAAIAAKKASESVDLMFVALVDVLDLKSWLVVDGAEEERVALAVFATNGTNIDDKVLPTGSRVSRKKDFIPALSTFFRKST